MRASFHIIFLFTTFLVLNSCKKVKPDRGIETVIKGHVSDTIRGINISGYKMVLEKSRYNTLSGTSYDEIATAFTNVNGDYSITFNYKLDYDGQYYVLSEQYYGTPYYPEYLQAGSIIAGITNIVNINAWKPINLNLNLQVLNNNLPPLRVKNEFNNVSFFNVESIPEQNIIKTYALRARPGSDINIIFYYYTNNITGGGLHQKTIPYHTPLNDVTLNYIVDCSTF